jgi:organic radical activating enzyme
MAGIMTIPVSEVYGPVFQGEGAFTGRPAYFLRLGMCNLHCSWCDTPFTWDESRFDVAAECPPTTALEIMAQLPSSGLLILSGGEPLIHQRNDELLKVLRTWRGDVHVETNGTLAPSPYMTRRVEAFTVSPKLGNQGDPESRRLRPEALAAWVSHAREFRPQVYFKFVCTSVADVEEAAALVAEYRIPLRSVWIMPEGVEAGALLDTARLIEQAAIERGFCLSLRQHVLLHGDRRAT